MDWNTLIAAIGNTAPVVIVCAYGWFRAEKRADTAQELRDQDNRTWADRYASLAEKAYSAQAINHTASVPPG